MLTHFGTHLLKSRNNFANWFSSFLCEHLTITVSSKKFPNSLSPDENLETPANYHILLIVLEISTYDGFKHVN